MNFYIVWQSYPAATAEFFFPMSKFQCLKYQLADITAEIYMGDKMHTQT